jgi:hypothetical protein
MEGAAQREKRSSTNLRRLALFVCALHLSFPPERAYALPAAPPVSARTYPPAIKGVHLFSSPPPPPPHPWSLSLSHLFPINTHSPEAPDWLSEAISLYSSPDLTNWKFEGRILEGAQIEADGFHAPWRIERPKV